MKDWMNIQILRNAFMMKTDQKFSQKRKCLDIIRKVRYFEATLYIEIKDEISDS